jgi:hypothetical protein
MLLTEGTVILNAPFVPVIAFVVVPFTLTVAPDNGALF